MDIQILKISIRMDYPSIDEGELNKLVEEKKRYLDESPVKDDIIFYIEMHNSFNQSLIRALETEVEKLSTIVRNYSDGYMLVNDSPLSFRSDEYDKCEEAREYRESKMKGD